MHVTQNMTQAEAQSREMLNSSDISTYDKQSQLANGESNFT